MLNFRTYNIGRLANPEGESGPGGKLTFQATGDGITGYLEMAQPEFVAMVDGVFGKTYRFFSDHIAADVQIGDRLTATGELYEVKGVNTNTDGPGRRLELVLIKLIGQ